MIPKTTQTIITTPLESAFSDFRIYCEKLNPRQQSKIFLTSCKVRPIVKWFEARSGQIGTVKPRFKQQKSAYNFLLLKPEV